MMSYTKSAIAVFESHIAECSEFRILKTPEPFDDKFISKYKEQFDVVIKVYTGESDKLTEIIEQDIFEHFQKRASMKDKLKNEFVPSFTRGDHGEVTIFIVAKK
jgi:hypothetical protein